MRLQHVNAQENIKLNTIDQNMPNSKNPRMLADVTKLESGYVFRQIVDFKVLCF